jgi:hypothetical protein
VDKKQTVPRNVNLIEKTKAVYLRLRFLPNKDNISHYLLGLAIAIGILSFGVILYYILFPSRGSFHSDTTDTILWAQASFDAKWIYNTDFNYAAFMPFGGHLLMLPFMPFFGVSMTTHLLGMTLFYVVMLAALVLFCRTFKFSWIQTALTCFIFVFGVAGSEKIREIFYGHIIYYSLGILFFLVGFSLTFRLEASLTGPLSAGKKRWIPLAILTGLFYLLTSLNGLQSFTLFTIPVAGGYFLQTWFDGKKKLAVTNQKPFWITISIILIGVIIGTIFLLILRSKVSQGYADAYSVFSNPSEWIKNANKFIEQWFTLIGVEIHYGEPLGSFKSILNMVRIVFGVLLLVIPVLMIFKYPKLNDPKLKTLLIGYWLMTTILMIGYVFGLLSSASWRLTPMVALAILCSIAYLKSLITQSENKRLAWVFLAPFLLVGLIHCIQIADMPKDDNLELGKYDVYVIARELEALDLEYGYANFWRANAVTVISDSRVRIRPITDELEIYHYQSQNAWYDDQTDVEQYFLVLTASEYNKAKQKIWYLYTHEEHLISGSQTYYVLVFDENIF